ncbi:ATP-binding cassette domain-containing protein [Micromonospora sp. LOL_025]|uniref:ATP-binding cassette domain-containing protein n=1 Tax=Micromonospora sp. LOL_025 TaxID=3345413 RepID=UPI003A8BFE44
MTVSLQIQDNDCGVQALISSLRSLGHDFPEPALRDALAARGALSLRDLRDTSAEVCGVRYRARRDCPFDALTVGAIVHLRANHYVTVERRQRRQVRIFDPLFGRASLDERGYLARTSGWVLLPDAQPSGATTASHGTARRARRPARVGWLWPLVRSGRVSLRQVAPVLAMSLLLYTGLTLLNLVLLPYLNQVSAGQTVAAGTLIGALTAFFGVLSLMFWYEHRKVTALGLAFDRAMLTHLVDRVTRASATTELTSGSVLHRVTSAREVREAGTNLALAMSNDAIAVVLLLGFLASMSLPLTGVVVALSALHIGLTILARRPINRRYDEQLRLEGEVQDVLITATRGLTTFRGLGAVGHLRAEHARRLDLLHESVRTLQYRLALVSGPSGALRFTGLYVILIAGSVLISADLVSTGELFGFLTLGGTVLFSVTTIAQNLTTVATLERQVRYVATLMAVPVMPAGSRTGPAPDASAVVLDGVRVHRPRDRFDLRLDLRIERGETVTVGGASGAGKSTMARIISGLDPTPAGRATVYGIPVSDWDPDHLRPLVCYVPPRSDFLHTTIRDSLCSGVPDTDDHEIAEVLTLVGLDEVLRPLRLGLRTTLRINGSTFSAGEVQRFALARALLRRPSLLILDEATNSLDRELELRVLAEIQQRVETLVVVSHRPVGRHLGSRHLTIARHGDGVSRVLATDE